MHGCDPGRVSRGSRLALYQTLSIECPSSIFFWDVLCVVVVVVVVFTSKTVLIPIQYLLFLTLQGKEMNFRGHKLTHKKVHKYKIKKMQRKSQHLRKNMKQVPKNNKFRKTRSRLDQGNPAKEVEPIAPTRKLSHKQNILHRSTNTSKYTLEEEAILRFLTKPGSVHHRVPADHAIPTQHPGAARRAKQN